MKNACAQRLSASKGTSRCFSRMREPGIHGAQRLSASKGTSRGVFRRCGHEGHVLNACRHRREHHVLKRLMESKGIGCSTPVGIEGNITGDDGRRPRLHRVLNACRHRREHHLEATCRAKRLSKVLNACRHRREHHNARHGHGGILGLVLNACRHRREHHGSWPCRQMRNSMCSTPVGIEGNITDAAKPVEVRDGNVLNACRHRREHHVLYRWSDAMLQKVLNACRHRREHHSPATNSRACAKRCSTPVGIEGNITCNRGNKNARRGCAQRLSASKGTSPVCCTPGITSCWGAQRLSASKGTSPPRIGPIRTSARVLNACRHRREHHKKRVHLSRDTIECSTPVGIEGNITNRWIPDMPRCGCAQRLSASKGTSLAVACG